MLAPDTGPPTWRPPGGTPVIGLYAHHNPAHRPLPVPRLRWSASSGTDRTGDRQAAGRASTGVPASRIRTP